MKQHEDIIHPYCEIIKLWPPLNYKSHSLVECLHLELIRWNGTTILKQSSSSCDHPSTISHTLGRVFPSSAHSVE